MKKDKWSEKQEQENYEKTKQIRNNAFILNNTFENFFHQHK